MYLPPLFAETNTAKLHALIQARPLGTWITQHEGELLINHIPFLLDTARGAYGTLFGHVARANPMWQQFSKQLPSAVVFHGAQAYISPSWYPSKQKHQRAVPTWNYVVVHAHGFPQIIEDRSHLLRHITELSNTHERSQQVPWQVTDAPVDYIDKMLGAIVGIEIPIDKLTGKWKVSQNRSVEDQLGTIAGLRAQGDPDALAMAELIASSAAS